MNEGAKPDVQTMEQEVRRRWAEPVFHPFGPAGICIRHDTDNIEDDGTIWFGDLERLYVFTLAHAQKIAELREEIDLLCEEAQDLESQYADYCELGREHETVPRDLIRRARIKRRTIPRLESALQELLRGWKGE